MQNILLLVLLSLLVSCSQNFTMNHVAKSDISMVADLAIKHTEIDLQILLDKLYQANPQELAKVPGMTIQKRKAQIYGVFPETHQQVPRYFVELENKIQFDAINLAFDANFKGDRVFALMVGTTGMLRGAYGFNNDFYMMDKIDAQSLYNSARNMELIAKKLRSTNNHRGQPLIRTLQGSNGVDLSFERLYGRIISRQDFMARVMEDRGNRTIKTAIQTGLRFFLPI